MGNGEGLGCRVELRRGEGAWSGKATSEDTKQVGFRGSLRIRRINETTSMDKISIPSTEKDCLIVPAILLCRSCYMRTLL